jgi:ABC-2 type transport system ATP-binding protein
VLEAVDVSVDLSGRQILAGFTLTLDVGVTAVVGRNGAGKTTLLRVLAGILRPSQGQLRWNAVAPYGSQCATASYHAVLGWVPQQVQLPWALRVQDFLEHAAWLKAVPSAMTPRRVARAMEATDVTEFAARRLGALSGGERQRVLLASALVNDPQVVILDEPTAGLDPAQREAFLGRVRALAPRAVVVLATHVLDDVHLAADRVVGIRDGALVAALELPRREDRPGGSFADLRHDLDAVFAVDGAEPTHDGSESA